MAIAILAVCVIPVAGTPTVLLRRQLYSMEEAAVARLAMVDFADIKGKLYRHEITWEMLCNTIAVSKRTQSDLQVATVPLYLPEKREFERSVYFYTREKTENLDDRLVEVHLRYHVKGKKKPHKFMYKIYAKKTQP